MPQPTKAVEVEGELLNETTNTFKFTDGERTVWLPRSLCLWDESLQVMTLPEWLAIDRGLV